MLSYAAKKETPVPDYIPAYRGGRLPETSEEGKAQMQRWKDWLADLDDAIINPGKPGADIRLYKLIAAPQSHPEHTGVNTDMNNLNVHAIAGHIFKITCYIRSFNPIFTTSRHYRTL